MIATRSVSVVGLGKLGAPIAAVAASAGHDVVGIDVDPDKVEAVNRGRAPVFEPELDDLIGRNSDRLRAVNDYEEAIAATDLTLVVVPTPSDPDGGFSLKYVVPACEAIGRAVRSKNAYHLVALVSTVLPGSSEQDIVPAIEAASGLRCGTDFGFCYSPEFVALGTVINDLVSPDFVLIGESDPRAGNVLAEFYDSIHKGDVPAVRMSTVNAELTKLSLNTYVTMKITFANMLAGICERLPGADVDVVTNALGLDRRIGRPYLKGALGYGGPCFPRDNRALTLLAERIDAPADLAAATELLNSRQIPRVSEFVSSRVRPDGRVAILGLAYKPGTDVTEESQGVLLAQDLLRRGISVAAHDPAALANAQRALPDANLVTTAREAVEGADAVVITTPWAEYEDVTAFLGAGPEKQVVVDCWRMLSKEKLRSNVEYVALGTGD